MDNYLSGGIRKWSFVLVLICLDNMWLSSCNVVLHLDYFRAIKFVQIKKIYLYESLNDCCFSSVNLSYIYTVTSIQRHMIIFPTSSAPFFSLFYLFFFRDTRSTVLEESLRKLGVEKLSKDDVQKMQWEVLEAKIGNWIHFMRIAVRTMLNILVPFIYGITIC